MKLIGAGFGRTGTASLQAALETVGLRPCYHMREVFARPDDALFWERAALGQDVDFRSLFKDWQATVDWPACTFYRELMELYPEAKVLLSVRDPEKWYESCQNTIYPATALDPSELDRVPYAAGTVNAADVPLITQRMINRLIWQRTFQNRFEDRAYAIDVFNRHNEEVRRAVPPERLLVFEARQGWEPLCRFLGAPIPEGTPYPYLNDTASFLERSQVTRSQETGVRRQ
jgi:hypothetical protein